MQVEINPKDEPKVSLANMKVGEVGVDKNGNIYFRTMESALSLPEVGNSYSGNIGIVTNVHVTLLPPGTKIVITL